jgi:hypothetical protein
MCATGMFLLNLSKHKKGIGMNVTDIINKLAIEGELFDDWFTDNDGNDYFPGTTMLEAAECIQTLRAQVEELLPYMKREMESYLSIGPPPDGHDDDCADCHSYKSAVEIQQRLADGEFVHE